MSEKVQKNTPHRKKRGVENPLQSGNKIIRIK